jgi:hypothetical protein
VRKAILAAALALATPAAATASIWPAPSAPAFPAVTLTPAHARQIAPRSCMAREQHAKVSRWLAPVACEQPPRSEVVIALFGD